MCIYDPKNQTMLSIQGYWGIIGPIITLSLGYLFGEHKSRKADIE